VRLEVAVGRPRPELLRRVLIEALGGESPPGDATLDDIVARAETRRTQDLRAADVVGEVRAAVGVR
jgi:hypothetical protein